MIFKDKFYIRVAVLGTLFLLGYLLYLLTPVIVPFIVAFILAYLLNPVVAKLGKLGVSRIFSIVLVFFAITVFCCMAFWYIIPLLLEQFNLAKNNMPIFLDWLNYTARPWISTKVNYNIEPFNTHELSDAILNYLQTNYNVNDAKSIMSKIASSGISAVSSMGLMVLVPVLAFFFMVSWQQNMSALTKLVPPHLQNKTLQLIDECHLVMMAFVKGQLLVMLILGLIYGLLLQFAVGLETGLMIGLAAGVSSIIPYFGLVVGVVAAVIATIVQFGFDWHLVGVAFVFMTGQLIEGWLLQPFLLGDRIGLSPIMVVFVVLVGGSLMGLVGMLIALPLAAVIMVLMRHAFTKYQQSSFYTQLVPVDEFAVNVTDDVTKQDENTESSTEQNLELENNVDDLCSQEVELESKVEVLIKKNEQPVWLKHVPQNSEKPSDE